MASLSDDSDEENFVTIGIAVPDSKEDAPLKKPISIQDLTARDKQGRRRFHGAFTGGFSAGFFNTVGSKEGFTPSTFVSSRQDRHDKQGNKPEDFMDEEDLEEHGIAPRKFTTSSNFTSDERKRKHETEIKNITSGASLDIGSAFADIVVPEQLPIGIKLLRKMGWREGQGLGPRIQKKKKTKKSIRSNVKTYGCALPDSESDSDSFIPENLSNITFAPQDISPISLDSKDNVHGLGYRGLNPKLALPGSQISLFDHPSVKNKKSGKGIKGQAFGVGAFEDEDEDIYAVDSMSNYDVTMQLDDGEVNHFGWTAPRKHGQQKLPVTYVGKLLEGFSLSSRPLKPKKKYPAPVLPAQFKPQHWFRKSRITSHLPDQLTVPSGSSQSRQLTAVDRGLVLDEKPIMQSVFDLVNKDYQQRIEATKQAIDMTRSLKDKTSDSSVTTGLSLQADSTDIPSSLTESNRIIKTETTSSGRFRQLEMQDVTNSSSSNSDKSSLFQGNLNFKPFRKDPAKQERYDQYLAFVKQGVKDPYSLLPVVSMTEWERSKERDEFSKTSRMFRPLSAMMSSRFVASAMIDDNIDERKEEIEKSDQEKAAEMKMFGKLTREEFEWHPDKLVCRRFNVPNPYPESDTVGVPGVKRDKYSVFSFLNFSDYNTSDTQQPPESRKSASDKKPQDKTLNPKQTKKKTFASIFTVLDDPDFHKPNTAVNVDELKTEVESSEDKEDERSENSEPPDQDLFRAIFKNSDSEDSDNSEDDNTTNTKTEDSTAESTKNIPENIDSISPPANSSLVAQQTESFAPVQSKENSPRSSDTRPQRKSIFSVLDDMPESQSMFKVPPLESSRLSEESEDTFGPALPPSAPSFVSNEETKLTPNADFLKEIKRRKQDSKRKKSKHKIKKHKKKSKKSKKKRRRSSSSDSSEEEDSNDSFSETIEKLAKSYGAKNLMNAMTKL